MATRSPEGTTQPVPVNIDWRTIPPVSRYYAITPPSPSRKSLALAGLLFLLTLCTCLVAGAQFAVAFAHNESVSVDEFVRDFKLLYQHPAALLSGLPFAITLLTILLAHELGHFFACRHHHIRTSYPFFVPAPTLIGTFGAFILLRSPIRNTRALFDVGASGPFVGFLFALPALVYGVMNAKNRSRSGRPSQFRHSVWRPFNSPNPCQDFSPQHFRGFSFATSSGTRRMGRPLRDLAQSFTCGATRRWPHPSFPQCSHSSPGLRIPARTAAFPRLLPSLDRLVHLGCAALRPPLSPRRSHLRRHPARS